ncbi:MAG: biliverdin-producing heme oxygenase [Chloroflexales bacterium]|nr:biliverdin-producing heme oxygenase [Chloroflexales bacterium]
MYQIEPFVDTLRNETYEQHAQIGALPFFQALAERDLSIDSYVSFLKAMTIVHSLFELIITEISDPVVVSVWSPRMHKFKLLQSDLRFFTQFPTQPIPDATLRAHVLAEQIRVRANTDPLSLLGYLYAFLIWNLGGSILCSQIAQTFDIDGSKGLAYLASYDEWGRVYWNEFTSRMEEALVEDEAQKRVIDAAYEAFRGIERIIEVLHPIANTQDLRELVTSLNSSAGNHQIPDNILEIRAAFRAGERSQQQLPYYEMRYGTPGRRYTWSDATWLAALTREEQAKINDQIVWLAQFLSQRGMPQWMMEQHLEILYQELVKVIPEKQDEYAKLLVTANVLADMRRVWLSDEVLLSLAQDFDEQAGPEWSARLPLTGFLLASAVADEHAGMTKAVTSLEGWLTEPSRFPKRWIEAVHATIQQAREQCNHNLETNVNSITPDIREIQAAFRAGERSWQKFPYYSTRYGAEKQGATWSDSRWLSQVLQAEQSKVDQQVLSLAKFLSQRGMSQWMMEQHLEILYQELAEAIPEKQDEYAKLLASASVLTNMRQSYISEEVFQSLAQAFDEQVGPEWSARLPYTGFLLVSAVADEHAGITGAVTSLESWLTEPSRFPEKWIEAVRSTIRQAREETNGDV